VAGHALQDICNSRHIPFQGELGGNNAAIVWEDCDLNHAAAQIASAAFGFAGQRCTANRRAVVSTESFSVFIEELQKAFGALKWGDPFDPATIIGPLISTQKRDAVAKLTQSAKTAGMQILTPQRSLTDHDELCRRGAYFPPTIVVAEDPNEKIVQDETFGPVLVVQRARTFDHAIELVNAVPQGLVAALFSDSAARQQRFLSEVQAGILKLNCGTSDADAVSPFGGWKASGIGPAEHGPADREFFTRVQTIYDERSAHNSTL
jgi:acyl-CoA reductase-like NAD-dependent aldehyde dehydrogenase